MPDASNLPPHAGAGSGAWWWTVIVIVIILIIAAALGLGGANSPRDHNLRQEMLPRLGRGDLSHREATASALPDSHQEVVSSRAQRGICLKHDRGPSEKGELNEKGTASSRAEIADQ